ncbi:MAG: YajQ family cyclic di-GMP-binding protein [Polaromonas sp.]|uniref:YajQ family cyclic di-GMP-binding protein n=1 Tax=Polaromonas sp. TaxID=1869339 RepID=UPI0032634346
MPSFDTVLEADLVKVKNAVENTSKEVGNRFDFKGTSASIELKDKDIILVGDGDFQIDQINDILRSKLAKAGVDVRFLDTGKIEKIGGDKVKQTNKVRNGIDTETAKKIQAAIKASKLKVQAAIQEEKVRVTGAKRDDLQAAMALILSEMKDFPLSFDNRRD